MDGDYHRYVDDNLVREDVHIVGVAGRGGDGDASGIVEPSAVGSLNPNTLKIRSIICSLVNHGKPCATALDPQSVGVGS